MRYKEELQIGAIVVVFTLLGTGAVLSCNGEPAEPAVTPGLSVGDTVQIVTWCGANSTCYGVVRQMYGERLFVDFPDSCTGDDYPGRFYQDGWYEYHRVNPKKWNLR